MNRPQRSVLGCLLALAVVVALYMTADSYLCRARLTTTEPLPGL